MKIIRCSKCGRRYRGKGYWVTKMKDGVAEGYECPDCQPLLAAAAATAEEATHEHGRDAFGRLTTRPKE